MAQTPLATIKNWFKTGLKPTQGQFWDTWDSFWHKADTIPQASVAGLETLENRVLALENAGGDILLSGTSATTVWSAPAGVILHKLRIKSTSNMTLDIGTSPSGTDVLPALPITAGQVSIPTLDYDIESAQSLYFSGLAGSWTIKIVLQ